MEVRDPSGAVENAAFVVTLGRVPGRGCWFELDDGGAARLDEVRMIAGELVLFATREAGGAPSSARVVKRAVRREAG